MSPDNRVRGGKILAIRTKPTTNRRLRAKLGGAAAVTAMAHKLARILYVMIKTRQPYRPDLHDAAGELHRARTLARFETKAKDLGFQLVPTRRPASA